MDVTCRIEGCGLIFKSGTDRGAHERTHEVADKKYRCNECGQSFKQPTSLSKHKLTHSDIRPFICLVETCKKSFTQ
jgi:uncharacterized Zn-finger protein